MPRGDVAVGREPPRGAVALFARPRLDVADGIARALDVERHAELLAQRCAMGLVAVGLRAQPVVAVQRADVLGSRDPHGDVEQADRVAAAGEQDQHRPARLEQPAGADAREEIAHSPSPATNSSVGSLNPFSVTSPIWSKRRWSPAASITGRVTSTSPPAARAATRAARLTARP